VSELLKNDGMTCIGDPDSNSGTCQKEHSWRKIFWQSRLIRNKVPWF